MRVDRDLVEVGAAGVAADRRRQDVELLLEQPDHRSPRAPRPGEAVDEQQRRAAAAPVVLAERGHLSVYFTLPLSSF